MHAYTATFSNGLSISLKNSKREVAYAWIVKHAKGNTVYGWTDTEAKAQKAIDSQIAYWGRGAMVNGKRKKVAVDIAFKEIIHL